MGKHMAKIQNNTRGACGEHYVASYLSGMGLVVGITTRVFRQLT